MEENKKRKVEKRRRDNRRAPTEKSLKIEADNRAESLAAWKPKTEIGRKVKDGTITDINQVIEGGHRILEAEIVDYLIPGIQNDLLLVGQSKGKFGGGQRRVFRQTQKKTKEGNKPSFSTYAIVGNGNCLIGYGFGKAKETVPAREKAIRNAKLNIISIKKGSGSWESTGETDNSIPFAVTGKSGSVIIKLMPAPVGIGLCCEKEVAKILKMAGIKDIWSKTFGKTKTKQNLIEATFKALRMLQTTKVNPILKK